MPAPLNLKVFVRGPEVNMRSDGGWRITLRHSKTFDDLAATGEAKDLSHPLFQQALESAIKIAPTLQDVRLEGFRYGVRPMPRDGRPIIGFDPDISGFYHAVMHSGITLSAIVGSLVTEEFLGGQPRDLEPFRIERFSEPGALDFSSSEE